MSTVVTTELIEKVLAALAHGNAADPTIAAQLRETFPGVVFSVASDDDIPSRVRPLAQGDTFALYGIATGGHCASLTSDRESAGGLLVALTGSEE